MQKNHIVKILVFSNLVSKVMAMIKLSNLKLYMEMRFKIAALDANYVSFFSLIVPIFPSTVMYCFNMKIVCKIYTCTVRISCEGYEARRNFKNRKIFCR
jgi:hypothetical protein